MILRKYKVLASILTSEQLKRDSIYEEIFMPHLTTASELSREGQIKKIEGQALARRNTTTIIFDQKLEQEIARLEKQVNDGRSTLAAEKKQENQPLFKLLDQLGYLEAFADSSKTDEQQARSEWGKEQAEEGLKKVMGFLDQYYELEFERAMQNKDLKVSPEFVKSDLNVRKQRHLARYEADPGGLYLLNQNYFTIEEYEKLHNNLARGGIYNSQKIQQILAPLKTPNGMLALRYGIIRFKYMIEATNIRGTEEKSEPARVKAVQLETYLKSLTSNERLSELLEKLETAEFTDVRHLTDKGIQIATQALKNKNSNDIDPNLATTTAPKNIKDKIKFCQLADGYSNEKEKDMKEARGTIAEAKTIISPSVQPAVFPAASAPPLSTVQQQKTTAVPHAIIPAILTAETKQSAVNAIDINKLLSLPDNTYASKIVNLFKQNHKADAKEILKTLLTTYEKSWGWKHHREIAREILKILEQGNQPISAAIGRLETYSTQVAQQGDFAKLMQAFFTAYPQHFPNDSKNSNSKIFCPASRSNSTPVEPTATAQPNIPPQHRL